MAKIKNYQEYLAEMAEIKVTCAKCGRQDARLTPMGAICLTCTFEKREQRAKAHKSHPKARVR